MCKICVYQIDMKGEFLNAASAELFMHLSFITLYNDSEMKGKTRGGEIEEGSEIEERGLVVLARLASAEPGLVSPEGNGASSYAALGFPSTRGLGDG